jgi:biofilm PGA synthesis N-glycosyltransferase PgaC
LQNVKYAIVTAARDEEKYIEATINSVTRQTIQPAEWVIVDDGSTDNTGSIIDQYAERFPWIRAVHRPNRGFRKPGGGVVDAFYEGYNTLRHREWEFIVKLDADLSFSEDYFEKCFERFDQEPGLGIGGGDIYHDLGGRLRLQVNPRFHVRGATKIYRRACWEAIGGLWPAPGWDTIDEVKANMLGWKTRAFEDPRLLHHRLTGSGLLRDSVKHGVVCYVCGYHPLFVAASCLYRLIKKPYIVGSAASCYGFLRSYFTRAARVNDAELIRYVRTQQLRRLCGLQTIWR